MRSIQPATTRGSLYDLPFGFPGLVVPRDTVHANGTTDYAADAHQQHQTPAAESLATGNVVHGELLTFDDPVQRLPALDGLEGYDPDGTSLYERILIPIEVEGSIQLAWAYSLTRPAGALLPEGRWPN